MRMFRALFATVALGVGLIGTSIVSAPPAEARSGPMNSYSYCMQLYYAQLNSYHRQNRALKKNVSCYYLRSSTSGQTGGWYFDVQPA